MKADQPLLDRFPLADFVDALMPLLTPYEAAFYTYMYRNSVETESGRFARTSARRLQTKVVRSARSPKDGTGPVSQQQVRDVLRSLERFGAIRKDGEVNREGTLYRIFDPREIPACKELAERLVSVEPQMSGVELDYYNVPANRAKVYERDEYLCRYCRKQLTTVTATLDHVVAVSRGGGNDFDNLVTACLECNSKKHCRLVGDFLAESP
jgi:HNH endonuclease